MWRLPLPWQRGETLSLDEDEESSGICSRLAALLDHPDDLHLLDHIGSGQTPTFWLPPAMPCKPFIIEGLPAAFCVASLARYSQRIMATGPTQVSV
jgi:hypothetical protein